ncbi:hypothetical protein FOG18_07610 [Legionella israelensis]|uniref:hypothetical protein n=1 Tax=Legionella israelensis TaxID=454 RepID=UPI00117FC588|nr:hypothetical protein [Legionella israelensis]QDP72434.1 hypothetical protein FOG18_07610 [Legionella israelensis]
METPEHKNAGDLIRIETFDNPYLEGSKSLSEDEENVLKVTMMRKVDGVPVPLPTKLTAGDIVALAGDYYTEAGWGFDLEIPEENYPDEQTREIFHQKIENHEYRAFRKAYENLASPDVTAKAVERIYSIERNKYIPSLLKQLIYAFTVKGYGNKLTNNEAHFSPWSVRAYIVGHTSALRMAKFAHVCKQMMFEEPSISFEDQHIKDKIEQIIRKINKDPAKYQFSNEEKYGQPPNLNQEAVLKELLARYHAMAVARDLFAMHFYSDHFAGGHLDRIGTLRQTLPKKFGTWGSVLINNMHNEDNTDSVSVTDPYQPDETKGKGQKGKDTFTMIREDNQAYGDGTYFKRENNANADMLVNGMDNSLGDIARLMNTGKRPEPTNYGGLAFLPAIDLNKRQSQPLLIQGKDGQVYFRSEVSRIKILSPSEYRKLLEHPENNKDYKKLTKFKAFALVFKLRVISALSFGLLYSPKVEKLSPEQEKQIADDENKHQQFPQSFENDPPKESSSPEIKVSNPRKIPTKSVPSSEALVGSNPYSFHNREITITAPIEVEEKSFSRSYP